MASKDSQELKSDERYPLGDYSFRIERSAGTSPGYDKIEAICTKGGKNARKSIQVPSSTKINGWYVEANETEASVYVNLEAPGVPIGDFDYTSVGGSCVYSYLNSWGYGETRTDIFTNCGQYAAAFYNGGSITTVFASTSPFTAHRETPEDHTSGDYPSSSTTVGGQTIYYASHTVPCNSPGTYSGLPINSPPDNYSIANAAARMVLGEDGEQSTKLVGRFAIDIKDAGGDGPGSDWEDPGDYDPDWEEGDPTHTLYVTVTGALSGRHNDPIVDPSYSYIPADKDTVKQYGCGGDGGHGGGGGAGASTVVIHKFATNQANSKEVTAIARRHGYGSGGGKGGKGGDGCILVYY